MPCRRRWRSGTGKLCRSTATPDVALEIDRIWNETDIRGVLPSVRAPALLTRAGLRRSRPDRLHRVADAERTGGSDPRRRRIPARGHRPHSRCDPDVPRAGDRAGRRRPGPGDGAVHRHRGFHRSERPSSVTPRGRQLLAAHDERAQDRDRAVPTGATSTRPATGCSPRSMDPRGPCAARARSRDAVRDRSASRSGRAVTPARSSWPATTCRASPCTSVRAWRRWPDPPTCSSPRP